MSFVIGLKVDEEGQVELFGVSGDAAKPPAGTYTITGHVPSGKTGDWNAYSLSVSSPNGGVAGYTSPPVQKEAT